MTSHMRFMLGLLISAWQQEENTHGHLRDSTDPIFLPLSWFLVGYSVRPLWGWSSYKRLACTRIHHSQGVPKHSSRSKKNQNLSLTRADANTFQGSERQLDIYRRRYAVGYLPAWVTPTFVEYLIGSHFIKRLFWWGRFKYMRFFFWFFEY